MVKMVFSIASQFRNTLIPNHNLKSVSFNFQITSEQVVEAYIERCKEANQYLNAIVEPRYDAALREARGIDKMIASTDSRPEDLEKEFPLLGIPMTVKESIAVEGKRFQFILNVNTYRMESWACKHSNSSPLKNSTTSSLTGNLLQHTGWQRRLVTCGHVLRCLNASGHPCYEMFRQLSYLRLILLPTNLLYYKYES